MFDSSLSLEEASRVIRQTAHDLRNHVNALEMELLCLLDESPDAEVHAAVQRMQRQTAQLEGSIRTLSASLRVPEPEPVAAADLFEQWRSQHRRLQDSIPVIWKPAGARAVIHADSAVALCVLRGMLAMLTDAAGEPLEASVESGAGSSVHFRVTAPAGGVPASGAAWGAHCAAARRCPATLTCTPDGRVLTLVFPGGDA